VFSFGIGTLRLGRATPDLRSRRPRFRLYCFLRRGGGGRRNRLTIVTETTIMIIIGIVLSIAGLGFFCWALFTLAVYYLYLNLQGAAILCRRFGRNVRL